MMNLLILGSHGRLAAALAQNWGRGHSVVSLSKADLDVADLSMLETTLRNVPFDILVNGTGITNVDRCESDRHLATLVNAEAPGVMARAANEKSARLIHFSTDYVFDGQKKEPYDENDRPAPLGWYGRTKLDGEEAVLAAGDRHLVVRVSWIFGPDKPSFIDMLIEQARTRHTVEAIADKISAPTFACDVADWLEPFFANDLPGGILHACNAGGCSWREYGEHALQCAASVGVPLATTTVHGIALRDMKQFVAPRPPFTTLSTKKLTELTGRTPRPWRDAVHDYISKHYASIPSSA
jgi:dTDP-4-dehydrorhamnose reductase